MFEEVLGVALGCLKVYLRAQSMMVDFLNITLGLDQGVTIIRIFKFIQIYSDTYIRSYYIHIIFWIRIYSDIRSYCFSDTNIYGYSFVSFLIRIHSGEKSNLCAKSPKVKWLKLVTHRLIYNKKLLPLCCVNYVLTFCYK